MHSIRKNFKIIVSSAAVGLAVAAIIAITRGHTFAVLDPQGAIATQQRTILIIATVLILVIVLPVIAMTFAIAWRYREQNTKARYTPDWDGDGRLETIWWGIPVLIIIALSSVIWTSSHALDPYKPIASATPPLQVQVVALPWKWLFIYPEQHIASVNLLKMPVGRPVEFTITSDAAMNSLWIPQLGGQVYAMAGMNTKLHLIADKTGNYRGSSANISGTGFADMHFIASAVSSDDFATWATSVQNSGKDLTQTSYATLARPGTLPSPDFYRATDATLYDTIINKYMYPAGTPPDGGSMEHTMMGH